MSSAAVAGRILILVFCVSSVHSWWGSSSRNWLEQKPSTCPDEDSTTHKCTKLVSRNFTCVTIRCCEQFGNEEGVQRGEFSDSDDVDDSSNIHYLDSDSVDEDDCRYEQVCFTVKRCTLYKCETGCCDGYTRDIFGRCQSDGSEVTCENGGTRLTDNKCSCPSEFTGRNCETPVCDCVNGADCVIVDDKPTCDCPDGLTGDRCEQPVCEPVCLNGGTCVGDRYFQYCKCPANFVGKLCERPFTSSEHCPAPVYSDIVAEHCSSDSMCPEDQVCCKEGATTKCRDREPDCMHEGRHYNVGETITSRATGQCVSCTCMSNNDMQCMTLTCATPNCDNPTVSPGECCPRCPDSDYTPPTVHCPSQIHLATDVDRNYVTLTQRNVRIFDDSGSDLKVTFEPERVNHCACKQFHTRSVPVQIVVEDTHGNLVTCHVHVFVEDTQPPVITTCTEDVYIFEDEIPIWKTPVFQDNVGIMTTFSPTDETELSAGNYSKQYRVYDFDGNSARCVFTIVVSSRDKPFDQLPQGMQDRSSDRGGLNIALILSIACGLLLLVLVLVAVFCCCKRCRAHAQSPDQRHPQAYGNVIYSVPVEKTAISLPIEGKVELPAYSDLPPAYSVINPDDLMEYKAPSTYDSPKYSTLPEKADVMLTQDSAEKC